MLAASLDEFVPGDLAIVVGIDALTAIDSNRYADPAKRNGAWIEQMKPQNTGINGAETEAYNFIGAAANGLLVVLTSWSGGGTGVFYTLHIVDAAWANAFDEDGARYRRLVLTPVRSVILGDRWQGDVTIAGNAVRIETTASRSERSLAPVTIDARRP